ncbi:MAG TPA: 3-deoxy-8-phosphooctulonate synthase, partial [bacterium]
MNTVHIQSISIGEGHPLALIAGPCVIESERLALDTAAAIRTIAERLGMPFIFKSSYQKDNRSSSKTFQGPGVKKGLAILRKVKAEIGVPVLSDIHDRHDAKACAEVLDVIQIPAYLCMQTDLAIDVARTGKAVNVKKGQFMDPNDMKHVVQK